MTSFAVVLAVVVLGLSHVLAFQRPIWRDGQGGALTTSQQYHYHQQLQTNAIIRGSSSNNKLADDIYRQSTNLYAAEGEEWNAAERDADVHATPFEALRSELKGSVCTSPTSSTYLSTY